MTPLHPSDKVPALTVALPGGNSLQLPDALNGHYGVVLFYRGSWCPCCNAQLSAFERARKSLRWSICSATEIARSRSPPRALSGEWGAWRLAVR